MTEHIPIGDVNFGVVRINSTAIGTALQEFIQIGSQKGQISKDDLEIIYREGTNITSFRDVADAIKHGTRLFDALAYFSLPAAERPEPEHRPLGPEESDPSPLDIGRAIFYVYFYILIRGHAPTDEDGTDQNPVPNFLKSVMGLEDSPDHYSECVASFDLNLLDHHWVKYIQINNLGIQAQNRLALGLAGYRLPGVLTLFQFRDDAPVEAIRAATAVRNFVNRGAVWDCHSVTRTAAFLDVIKNFNANVTNVILEVYTAEQIAQLRRRRVLPVDLVHNERFTQWQQWTDATFDQFTDYIFRRD